MPYRCRSDNNTFIAVRASILLDRYKVFIVCIHFFAFRVYCSEYVYYTYTFALVCVCAGERGKQPWCTAHGRIRTTIASEPSTLSLSSLSTMTFLRSVHGTVRGYTLVHLFSPLFFFIFRQVNLYIVLSI